MASCIQHVAQHASELPQLPCKSLLTAGRFGNLGLLQFTAIVHPSNVTVSLPLLQVLSEKLDVLRLAFYTAPISCAVLLPFFFIREVGWLLPAANSTRCCCVLRTRSCVQGDLMPTRECLEVACQPL